MDAAANKSNKTPSVSATPSATVTDTTPPKIQTSDPADNAASVTGEFTFTITFSEPMDKNSLSVSLEPPQYSLELTNWSNNDTVLFVSPAQLHLFEQTENTPYTLTLNAKDKAGNALSGDKEINFTTGFEVPRLASSTPTNGATNIPLDLGSVLLTFSKPVDTASFAFETTFPTEGYTWLEGDTQLSIDAASLNDESTYTVSFNGKGKNGQPFEGSFSFSTIPDSGSPHVKSTSPGDGATNVP